MNKVFLYSLNSVDNVSFDVFLKGVLKASIVGVLNPSGVWEGEFPSLPKDSYTIIAKTNSAIHGSETIYWDGQNCITKEEWQANAVRENLSNEITHLMSLKNGETVEQEKMLLEIYRLMGLDPERPLVVSLTQRSAGSEINQTLDSSPTLTTVTRQP